MDDWFAEPPYAGVQQRYRVLQRLHAQMTALQSLEILDLEGPEGEVKEETPTE